MTTDAPELDTFARNVTLEDLTAMLRDQQSRMVDIVAPAAAMRAERDRLVIEDAEPEIGPDGVTMTTGIHADRGLRPGLSRQARHPRRLPAPHPRAAA